MARWRLELIRMAVAHPKGSPDRKAALDAIAGQVWTMPDGRRKVLSRSTLYAWVAAHDAGGLLGLLPEERKDRGVKRVLVTLTWDGFFGDRIGETDHRQVADDLTRYIRSLWASGESGWRAICEKSTTRLIEISRDLRDVAFDSLPLGRLGGRANAETQFGVCDVNRRLAEAQRSYGIVAVKNRDNARYQDTIAPTIRRDYSLLKPREIVVGDVHPTDIMVIRADGSRAYRELLLRAHVNDTVRAVLLATATGADLDNLAALFGVQRLVVTAADPEASPPVAAVMEADDALRLRAQLALDGYTTAGSAASYEFHARTADARVSDVLVDSPAPGTVRVVVLARDGNGEAPADLLTAVSAALTAEEVRPLCDNVAVQSASIVPFAITAHLSIQAGPDPAVVMAAAEAALASYLAQVRGVGRAVRRSGIYAALHRPGVEQVGLVVPAADLEIDPAEAAHCTGVTLTMEVLV